MGLRRQLVLVLATFALLGHVHCRVHHLQLEDDDRRIIEISSFGFLKDGFLSVTLHNLIVRPNGSLEKSDGTRKVIGFTVDRTLSDGLNPYAQTNLDSNYCGLTGLPRSEDMARVSRLSLIFDIHSKSVKMLCSGQGPSGGLENLKIYHNTSELPASPFTVYKRQPVMPMNIPMNHQRRRRAVAPVGDLDDDMPPPVPIEQQDPPAVRPSEVMQTKGDGGDGTAQKINSNDQEAAGPAFIPINSPVTPKAEVPKKPNYSALYPDAALDSSESSQKLCQSNDISLVVTQEPQGTSISTSFVVYIATEEMEGLYNLYFHNCLDEDTSIDLNVSIVEENQGRNYLSAGEMPLPSLYFLMSIIFFISGVFWVFILRKSKRETGIAVYKIHYLMGALVFLKSLSLLFHSINYHYIQTKGTHVEGFAVLYYAVHLLKGALLFITILLIGTGYAFVKHLLSDKDKKIFMIVIPLQVLANVATIIIEESEEGEIRHNMWRVIFISVDLICCMAILFPVVWSIKHLQEASNTDGKAATNLKKLKLFRHFYIIVVCYIYFTRIIVNLLLQITVPFQYQWLDEMFTELTTFIFFVLTGYKFRPAANNPYLTLAHDSDDETETDIALTESGLTAGVSKRGSRTKKKTLKEIVYFDEDSDDDEEVLLEKNLNREANHDFL